MKYAPPIGSTDPNAGYVDRTGSIPGSPVPAAAIEPTMREIQNVIEKAGLAPDGANMEQLHQAIARMIANAAVQVLQLATTAETIAGTNDTRAIHPVGLKAALAARGRMIQPGEYIWMSGSNLSPNCAWPTGGLVLFSDWPDLQAAYNAGYLMATTAANRAAYPGYWITHASGLYLPNIGGLFPRSWTLNQTYDAGRPAGHLQADEIRSHVHYISHILNGGYAEPYNTGDGKEGHLNSGGNTSATGGAETRPTNVSLPVCIYLGRYKTEV